AAAPRRSRRRWAAAARAGFRQPLPVPGRVPPRRSAAALRPPRRAGPGVAPPRRRRRPAAPARGRDRPAAGTSAGLAPPRRVDLGAVEPQQRPAAEPVAEIAEALAGMAVGGEMREQHLEAGRQVFLGHPVEQPEIEPRALEIAADEQ